jgi:hypothetical protein
MTHFSHPKNDKHLQTSENKIHTSEKSRFDPRNKGLTAIRIPVPHIRAQPKEAHQWESTNQNPKTPASVPSLSASGHKLFFAHHHAGKS